MMNRRASGNNQNQNAQRRSGRPNFVPGGQIFQKQQTPHQQQTIVQQPAAPVQKPPQVVAPKTASPQTKPVVQPMEQQQIEQPVLAGDNKGEVKPEAEKKSWMNRKIPKKEKLRRRNLRLGKLLQPKNALMILHELVKNPTFTVSEFNGQFQAIVTVAGVQHSGLGKNKNAAKNAASEAAIKHMLKHKNVAPMEEDDGVEKMDTFDANESPEETPLPWQQVASFAVYKLFDSWGENPIKEEPKPKKVNSARKMPENPTSLNPISVINQMYPQATFDDSKQVGTPPNVVFTIQCVVDGQIFEGSGPSKKVAKKQAAYAACHKLLGLVYPPEQYVPSSQ